MSSSLTCKWPWRLNLGWGSARRRVCAWLMMGLRNGSLLPSLWSALTPVPPREAAAEGCSRLPAGGHLAGFQGFSRFVLQKNTFEVVFSLHIQIRCFVLTVVNEYLKRRKLGSGWDYVKLDFWLSLLKILRPQIRHIKVVTRVQLKCLLLLFKASRLTEMTWKESLRREISLFIHDC